MKEKLVCVAHVHICLAMSTLASHNKPNANVNTLSHQIVKQR